MPDTISDAAKSALQQMQSPKKRPAYPAPDDLQAWKEGTNDFEKFTAAYYVARSQKDIHDKLKWLETALQFALKINDESVKAAFPSLYSNIAKCYEDLHNYNTALENYNFALSFSSFLADDGYGNMIKAGINNGLERVAFVNKAE